MYEQDPQQPATAGPSRARTRSKTARVQSSVQPPSSSVGTTAEDETPATVDESGPTDQDPPSTQEPRLPRVVPHVSRVANMRDLENWDRCNEQLFNVLYLSTTGPAASYLLRYQPKGSERPNGIRAWEALISKYQNSSKQRIRILMRELNSTSMSPGQDPDTFLSRVYQLRDELENAGETVSEERLTDIVLEGLTSDYAMIKYNAECDPDISIQDIETTMRNMYANRVARKITSSKSYGRDSSMLVTSMPQHSSNQSSKFRGKCFRCGRMGHTIKECRSRQQSNSGNRALKWCSLHNTPKHDDSECRAQLNNREGSSNAAISYNHRGRNPRHRNNNRNYNSRNNNSNSNNFEGHQRQANTAVADSASTTAPSTNQEQPTATSTASTVVDTCGPPNGVGFSFLSGCDNHSTPDHILLKLAVDSGSSGHFLDSQLLPGIDQHMVEYTKLDPPMSILTAGRHLLYGTAKGVCVCCHPIYSERRFSPLGRVSRGHTGGRPTHRRFFLFYLFLVLHLPSAVLAFLFYREKGSALPFPRRPRSRILCTHDKVALHCWVLCEKKPQITPRFEPATQPSEGYEVTN